MFLPVGDEPNADTTPVATYALMAANVAVWLLVCVPLLGVPLSFSDAGAVDYVDTLRAASGANRLDVLGHATRFDLLMFRYGYRPAAPSVVSLFASMFLHGGWMHLAGNMLFLYIFGDNVEARLGARKYLLAYLGTGMVATLSYAAFRAGSPFPLVGASGAISGILGCYFVWFPHNRVRVLYSFFFFIERALIPARIVLAGYLVIENLLPLLFSTAGSGTTAYGAHVGGFVAGAAYAAYVKHLPHPRTRAQGSHAPPTHGSKGGGARRPFGAVRDAFERTGSRRGFAAAARVEDVIRLVEARQYTEAVALYRALGTNDRLAVGHEAAFPLADALTTLERYDEALQILRPYLAAKAGSAEARARTHLRMGLIYLRGLSRPASAYPHLLDVLDLGASEAVQDAARAALRDIEQPGRA